MPGIVEFPHIVQEAVAYLAPLFNNRPERDHLAEYLTGLLMAERKTVAGMVREFAQPPDQSCLNRFLTQVPWDVQKLNTLRLQWLQEDPQARYSAKATISLDNVLVSHTGELIEDVGCFWDHTEKRYLIAHDYVIAGYAIPGGKSYPLDYRRFVKKVHCQQRHVPFQSHNDLICDLVAQCIEQQIPGTFAFDSWFSPPQTLNFIHDHQRAYVAELKSNRLVRWRGRELAAQDLARQIPPEKRRPIAYGDKQQWYFTATVRLPKVGHGVRIVVLWGQRHEAEAVKILITNCTWWEVVRIQRTYRARWRGSECFHRDGKQHLGMGDCQIRNGQGQTRHLYLVFLSYSLLVRSLGREPCDWALEKLTTIGQGCRAVLKETFRRTLQWALEKFQTCHWKIPRIQAALALT